MPLGRLLTEVGATVLDVAYGRVDADRGVTNVVLLDPFDPPLSFRGAVVLAPGVAGGDRIIDLIEQLAAGEAAALVLREPVGFDGAVADAVAGAGLAVLELSRGIGWVQVAGALATTLAGAPDTAADATRTDADPLFELADSISQLLDAPVTIEDLSSRILAFSNDQGRADEPRKQSVLAKQVPSSYTDGFRLDRVFRTVYATDQPVYFDDLGEGVLPRAVVRIAAGTEVLGSIWAVVTEPLAEDRRRAFVEAAGQVALQLVHGRAELNAERRARRAVLAGLLAGGPDARTAARRLQIEAGSFCVLAVDIGARSDSDGEPRTSAAVRHTRIANALGLHLAAAHPGSLAGRVDETVYGILHLRADPESRSGYALHVAQQFVDRSAKEGVVVAVGTVVDDAADIDASRREADRTMRLLRSSPKYASRSTVRSEDAQMDLLLLDVHEQIAARRSTMIGPVPDLIAFDRENDTEFAKTLDAFLTAFGDVGQTAERLHLHPNTCRYRLRRVSEITGLDLGDADARFNAMLQFRLLAM